MTTSRLSGRLVRKAEGRGRIVSHFPARVIGGEAITVSKSNGVYTFDLDFAGMTELGSISSGDRDNLLALLWNEDTESFRTAALDIILGIGSLAQAWDADLDAIAALSGTGFPARTAANTWALRSLVAPAAGFTIAAPAGVAGDPTFALSDDLAALEALSGTNTIYYRSAANTWTAVTIGGLLNFSAGTLNITDAELAALGGLTSAADKLPYFTGSGTAALADFTAFARTLVDDANAAAAATTLGLGTGDSPQFTAVNIGHATDTTLTRVSAGVAAIEGSNILLASGLGSITQAYDAELAALAGLTSAADKVPYFTGAGTAAVADFTASGRAMVGTASAAAQTALLSAFTGDSGSGGVKGLVPAPAAGDAAAAKFLSAGGSWSAPAGAGDVVGPGSSTDAACALFDGTTGKLLQMPGSVADYAAARASISAAHLSAMAFNNVVINGGIEVSQELGTTGATLVNNTAKYTADMVEGMYNHGAATAVVTSGQIAAASFGAVLPGFPNGHRIKATTAITSPANGDFAKHRFKIEGYRVAKLGWGAADALDIVVAFQYYSTGSGTAMVRFSNSAGDRFYHHEITVAAGWNFYAITVPGDTSGTWLKTTGIGLNVEVFSSGKETTPGSTLDSWTATGKIQTTNSGNLLDTNNDETVVTGLYIAPGTQLPVAADLPKLMRPFDQELLLCKRYWTKTPPYAVAPAQNNADYTGALSIKVPTAASGTVSINWRFPVEMRAAPTIVTFNPGATNANWRDQSNGADRAVTVDSAFIATTSCVVEAAATVAGATNSIQATASARL